MEFTARQIAEIINGTVEGDPEVKVNNFGRIEDAAPGELAFLANPKYEEHIYKTQASVIIVNQSFVPEEKLSATLIKVPDAYSAFAMLLTEYEKIKRQNLSGIQQPVFIHATAKIGNNVFIGAFSYIGENVVLGDNVKIYPQVYIGENVVIDKNTVIWPGVKIHHNCVIGQNVSIHAGTIIGGDGFGFAPQSDGSYKKIPQIGNVVIEDFVEIGGNVTIDRSTVGSTIIRRGAKLDNLIQIAHNVEIGNNTVIAAQSGISGSTKIGKNVMIGGQAGIVGHLHIVDGVKINAQSGVTKSIKTENLKVTGTPAFDYTQSLRSQILNRNLPALEKRIQELEEKISELLQKKEG